MFTSWVWRVRKIFTGSLNYGFTNRISRPIKCLPKRTQAGDTVIWYWLFKNHCICNIWIEHIDNDSRDNDFPIAMQMGRFARLVGRLRQSGLVSTWRNFRPDRTFLFVLPALNPFHINFIRDSTFEKNKHGIGTFSFKQWLGSKFHMWRFFAYGIFVSRMEPKHFEVKNTILIYEMTRDVFLNVMWN